MLVGVPLSVPPVPQLTVTLVDVVGARVADRVGVGVLGDARLEGRRVAAGEGHRRVDIAQTVTPRVAVLPVSRSESVALTLTVGLAGPSRNLHLKLPLLFVLVGVPLSVPPVPQLTVTWSTSSVPGSLIE